MDEKVYSQFMDEKIAHLMQIKKQSGRESVCS
jgi:hypothetical protein